MAEVCKPGQTPLFQREWQPSAQVAKTVQMESSRDSTQSLHILIYKDTDGWNCYETNDLCAKFRNWKRMRQCLLAIKGSKLSSHHHALKEDSVLHPSYSPPHNLWPQYPHPRHVFPLCFRSLSFIINSHIHPLLKTPPLPNSQFLLPSLHTLLQILTSPSGSCAWGVSWWLGVSQSGL